MAVAKHIRIARTKGPEAGLDAYLNTPSSRLHPAYQTISRKRTPATKLAAYCELFADDLGKEPMRTPVAADAQVDVMQGLAEQLAALQTQIASIGQAPVAEPEFDDETLALAERIGVTPEQIEAIRGNARANAQATLPATQVNVITKGEAWEILSETLGGDPSLKGKNWDDDAEATNGQLYKLNTLGFLRIELDD